MDKEVKKMNWVQNLLGSASVADILVYAAIIAIFVLGIAKCVMPVLNTRRLLLRAIRNIKAGDNAKISWQDDKFLGKGSLFPHWSEYLNNLFFADGAYHNASAIEDYINEETVIEEPGRSVLADAIPGILVSLGFLGTLIGLSTGLANFSMEDSSAVQISIETLIPSMRYAFMTSIFGVIGSILFTMVVRMTNGFTNHALTEFYSAMKGRAGVLSVDPMTQVAIYQQEQTALIQKLERELGASIEAGVRPLQKSLNEFMSISTNEQMRFLNAVVERFVDQMDQTLKGQLRNFAVTLDETCRHHEEVQESYKANLAQLERMAREIAQYEKLNDQMVSKLDGYLNRMSAAQVKLEESCRRVGSSVEQMEGVAQKQNNYLQTVTAAQSEISKAATLFQQASEKYMTLFSENFQKSTQAILKASSNMDTSAKAMDAGAKSLENAHKALVGQINKDLRETLEIFDQNMQHIVKQLGVAVNEITASVENLPRAVGGTARVFEQQLNEMIATLQRAQAALDDAVARMR